MEKAVGWNRIWARWSVGRRSRVERKCGGRNSMGGGDGGRGEGAEDTWGSTGVISSLAH